MTELRPGMGRGRSAGGGVEGVENGGGHTYPVLKATIVPSERKGRCPL